MAKKLSKILWHDTKVDGTGKPVLPSVATDDKGLNGLLPGELFMHVGKEKVSLWALSLSGEVVEVSGKTDQVDIDLSDYLLKSVWDSVFEIKTDGSGQKYIFGKLPVVTKYGITMYADDGNVDIPQLAEGLPFDQRTIWINPETKQIEVIGGTGGGVADSVLWDNVEGKPSWITNTKPKYSYSEIEGTPDLSGYATTSSLNAVSTKLNDFLEGSDTDTVINKWKELETFLSGLTESDNLATILTGKADKSYVDTNFVTIAGTEDVTGLHNFVNGLKIGGLPITKKQDDVVYLDANLVVRGGITMYADNEVDIPSILDSLPIANANTQDKASKGIASFDSAYFKVTDGWVTLTSAPSSGASSLGELLNVDASIDATASVDRVLYQPAGSAMWTWKKLTSSGVVGDYLPITGGELYSSATRNVLNLRTALSLGPVLNLMDVHGNTIASFGHIPKLEYAYSGSFWINNELNIGLILGSDGGVYISTNAGLLTRDFTVLHSANFSSYALPLSGGTITNSTSSNLLVVKSTGAFNDWKTPIQVLTPDIQAGGHVNIEAGQSSTARNVAWFGLKYYGDSSYDNLLTMGLHSVDDALVINGYGNVGIGTTSPSVKLHIKSDSTSQGDLIKLKSNASWAGIFFEAASGAGWSANAATGNDFYLWNSNLSGRALTITAGGNLLVSGGITMYSDQRKKTILNHVELSLKQIADAPLIEHYYNSDQRKTTHVGSIAQYWAGLNDWFCKLDAEGFYTMEIQNCALASAISIARHLEKYESKTDKTIRKMKQRIEELEDEVERLKQN